MKKFFYTVLLMIALILTTTAYSNTEPTVYDNDVGIENVQSVTVASSTVAEFQMIKKFDSPILNAKDSITDNHQIYFRDKYNPYKYMSLAKSQDTINKLRQRQNQILYTINKNQILDFEIPLQLMEQEQNLNNQEKSKINFLDFFFVLSLLLEKLVLYCGVIKNKIS